MAEAQPNDSSDLESFKSLFERGYMSGVSLGGERYTSVEFARREWEGMWTKTWLLLGRSAEIPESGDFIMEEIGKESFVLVRQDDGLVRAFYNVCQHRGNRLVHEPNGCARSFRCNYHSWTWGIDGVLLSMQDEDSFPGGSPCGALRLNEVKCSEFGGFVWVNMDPDAQSLREFLGPVWDFWKAYSLETMTRIQAFSVNLPCNWKALIDNFQETYHFATVHNEYLSYIEDDYQNLSQEIFEGGHGLLQMKAALPANRFIEQHGNQLGASLVDELTHWELDPKDFSQRPRDARAALQRQKRRLGPSRGHVHYERLSDEQLTDVNHFTIFPNFAVGLLSDGMVFHRLRPHATDPTKCIYDAFQFVPTNSPVSTQFGNVAPDAAVPESPTDVPVQVIEYGERSIGPILDQDASTMAGQQLGLRSRGYQGARLTRQELRVAYYHFVIDRYISKWEKRENSGAAASSDRLT